MQGRSWMAALALAAATVAVQGPAALAGQPTPIKQTVKLSLRLDGITREDGVITIRPGNPGCRFKECSYPIGDLSRDSQGMFNFPPLEVETISADRNCSFAIAIKFAGKPEQTVRRILQIVPGVEGRPAAPQVMKCFVSWNPPATPVATKAEGSPRKK